MLSTTLQDGLNDYGIGARIRALRLKKKIGLVDLGKHTADRIGKPIASAPIETTIVRLKREYPGWGAPKIREKLRQQPIPSLQLPAISTVHAVLDRHGLVHRRRRRTL